MDFEDCVYNKMPDGSIMVGGYTLNSILSEHPIMYSNTNTDNNDATINQSGGSYSSIFTDLAVPAGLLYLQQNFKPNNNIKTLVKDIGIIQDSLYDNLIGLVSKTDKRKHNIRSRKVRNNKKNKTRKVR